MKRHFAIFVSILILAGILIAACVSGAQTEEPAAEEPAAEEPAAEEPAAEEPAAEEPAPEEPAAEEPAPEEPVVGRTPILLSSQAKPPLGLRVSTQIDSSMVPELGGLDAAINPEHVIGYVFPDGTIAMKVAPLEIQVTLALGLVPVGVVELNFEEGNEKIPPGYYIVLIDIDPQRPDPFAYGELRNIDTGDSYGLNFMLRQQVENPFRIPIQGSFAEPPSIDPSISTDSVCFMITVIDMPTDEGQYYRYCSEPGNLLSVRDNFPQRYEELIGEIEIAVARLFESGYPDDAEIVPDLVISEMEDPTNIRVCSDGEATENCGADIVGAPSASFREDHARQKDASQGESFGATAGVVSVRREIIIPDYPAVQPGFYWVVYWFDPQDEFIGATLRGITDQGEPVDEEQLTEQGEILQGQLIQTAPASFINADGEEETISWISAWRLSRWCCFYQRNCP